MTSASHFRAIAGRASLRRPYICLQCRRQASTAARRATSHLPTHFVHSRNASSKPFSERLRSKIWGTDTPPGPDNPYGAPGTFEREGNRRLGEKKNKGNPIKEVPRTPAVLEEKQHKKRNDVSTWEDMRVIGHASYGLKEWDEDHQYQGFMNRTRAHDKDVIASIIHRALVEVMTLKKANLPLVVRRDPFESTQYDHAENYEIYKHDIAQGATFEQSNNGGLSLKLESEELERTILDRIVPKETAIKDTTVDYGGPVQEQYLEQDNSEEQEEEMDATSTMERGELELETAEEVEISELSTEEEPQIETPDEQPRTYVPVDDSWRNLSLADPEFKFAVLKRVMQLTGRRIPDPEIASIKDPKALLTHLVKKPKPKKLVETLRTRAAAGLPNVEFRDRRYTPIDKENEIGRWKVIERELKARRLPVTGKGTLKLGRPVARA